MNPRKPYEGLINEDEIMKLVSNIDNTPNVEWADYNIDGDTVSYPMWKAVIASEGDTYEDFIKYFNETRKKMDNTKSVESDDEMVGVVEPDVEFDEQNIPCITESIETGLVFGGEDLAVKVKRLMSRPLVASDKTGVVEPKSEGMSKKTTKQVTEYDSTEENKPKVEKAKTAPKAGVGVVKAHDDMGKQNSVDVYKARGEKKGEFTVSDKTGVVDPKSEGFKNGAKPVIKTDSSTAIKATVEKAAPSPKAGVGVVKPTSTVKASPKPITFSDFLK